MSSLFGKAHSALKLAGINIVQLASFMRAVPMFLRDWRKFRMQGAASKSRIPLGLIIPAVADRDDQSGVASGDYFYQDLWAAQWIFAANPRRHLDVGSRIDGFVAHVATFRHIEVLDIRPLSTKAKNISFRQHDISSNSRFVQGETCDSLSCLNVLEHIGLGRYGDPLNPDGHLCAWDNLHALLEPGGMFYFAVPIGSLRVEFNAHRVFSLEYLQEMFDGKYAVLEFSYVDDSGDLIQNVDITSPAAKENFGCHFGCGLFRLQKNQHPC